MWSPKHANQSFYFSARHPAYTMRHHWKDCCRLNTNVFLKYGKLLKGNQRAIAGVMICQSRFLKQCVLDAFKADTYQKANEALEKMRNAKSDCFVYHFKAEDRGVYANFADAYKILKPIVDMGYYHMFLLEFFKRKFHPPKAVTRVKRHYELRYLLDLPPRKALPWKRSAID